MNNIKNVIIQAGGKGTRLKNNTLNKPKCLVPLNGKPLIQYAIEIFKDCEIQIIADYKAEVLQKYVELFYKSHKIKIIKANKKGTCAGINEALSNIKEDESICLIWSDLILEQEVRHDGDIKIFTTNSFPCRYKIERGAIVKENSNKDGIMGLFTFRNKRILEGLPDSGSFVGSWLGKKEKEIINIETVNKVKEIGTIKALHEEKNQHFCRFFNSVKIENGLVIKKCINEQYASVHEDEKRWYEHVAKVGYSNIPKILSFRPLTMEQVAGFHCHKQNTTKNEKQKILENFCSAINNLHNLEKTIAVAEDVKDVYLSKTIARVEKVKKLLPFVEHGEIVINGRSCKNPFYSKNLDQFLKEIKKIKVKNFNLIHGDCTFSNFLVRQKDLSVVLIDPRGSFGETKLYGDSDYDWAKFYYSLVGNYDSINNGDFILNLSKNNIEYTLKSNGWEFLEKTYLDRIPTKPEKIYLLNSLIWFSLCGYVIEDYDSIMLSFLRGVEEWNKYIK